MASAKAVRTRVNSASSLASAVAWFAAARRAPTAVGALMATAAVAAAVAVAPPAAAPKGACAADGKTADKPMASFQPSQRPRPSTKDGGDLGRVSQGQLCQQFDECRAVQAGTR